MNQSVGKISNPLLIQRKTMLSTLVGVIFSLSISILYFIRVLPLGIASVITIFPFLLCFLFARQEVMILALIAVYFGAGYFFSDLVMQGLVRGFFLFLIGLALLFKSGASKKIIKVQTPLDRLFIVWLAVISTAFVNGLLFKHNNFRYLMGDLYKFVEIIFIFWITTFIIRTNKQVKFFVWGFFILVLIFSGIDFIIFFKKAQILGGALKARVRAGAQFSSIFALIMAVCLILYEKRKEIRMILGVLILGFFAGFLVCFLRTGYVVLPITLLILFILYFYNEKRKEKIQGIMKLLSLSVLLLTFIGLFGLVITKINPNIDIIQATIDRVDSLINPGSTNPMGYRNIEIECIISQVVAKNPLFGGGLGGKYYSLAECYSPEGVLESTVWRWQIKHYVHNNYFEFILRTGLVGLIVFIIIIFKYLKDAISFYLNSENRFYKGFLLGSMGIFISSLMIAFSCNSLYSPFLFTIMAMTYSVAFLEKRQSKRN